MLAKPIKDQMKQQLKEFTPDFSRTSESVRRLMDSVEHHKIYTKLPEEITQKLITKTLEIVAEEIDYKMKKRNRSALFFPNKFKQELQYLNEQKGITQYERAQMAVKLLDSYKKNVKEKEKEEMDKLTMYRRYTRKSVKGRFDDLNLTEKKTNEDEMNDDIE